MTSPSVIDLTNILKPELAVVNSPSIANATQPYNNIIRDLNSVYDTLRSSNSTTNNILTHQTDMKGILTSEQQRLNQKQSSVDNYVTTQQRMMQLNDNYQKKYTMYTNIIIYITVVLIIILAITVIWNLFPFIPDFIVYMLYALLAIVSIPFIAYRIYQIRARDPIYFDQIKQSDLPKLATPDAYVGSTPIAAYNMHQLGLQYGTCFGSDCCADGLEWNANDLLCKPRSPTASPAS
jgi:ABC-type multidrug transport system fused ATPase/permease subunit